MEFEEDEQRDPGNAAEESGERQRIRPAVVGALDQAEDERDECDGRDRGSDRIARPSADDLPNYWNVASRGPPRPELERLRARPVERHFCSASSNNSSMVVPRGHGGMECNHCVGGRIAV